MILLVVGVGSNLSTLGPVRQVMGRRTAVWYAVSVVFLASCLWIHLRSPVVMLMDQEEAIRIARWTGGEGHCARLVGLTAYTLGHSISWPIHNRAWKEPAA
jgi:hypothetical protein